MLPAIRRLGPTAQKCAVDREGNRLFVSIMQGAGRNYWLATTPDYVIERDHSTRCDGRSWNTITRSGRLVPRPPPGGGRWSWIKDEDGLRIDRNA